MWGVSSVQFNVSTLVVLELESLLQFCAKLWEQHKSCGCPSQTEAGEGNNTDSTLLNSWLSFLLSPDPFTRDSFHICRSGRAQFRVILCRCHMTCVGQPIKIVCCSAYGNLDPEIQPLALVSQVLY